MTPQESRILTELKLHSKVMNHTLNRIAFRYSARIADLRERGYIIETTREGLGLFSYRLISEPRKI